MSDEHGDLLLDRLNLVGDGDVLDLGCGWGELLLRAVARTPAGRGTGVDSADWALERGRHAATERGLSHRLTFVSGNAATWSGSAAHVLCVGASHAWGGSSDALRALGTRVEPGGRLLFGDGCWEQPPTTEAADLFGPEVLTLGNLVGEAIQAGWTVLHLSTADQGEWDDFESTWRAGREEWLLAYPSDPRAAEVRSTVENAWREYLNVYRRVLGFAYLVLAR